MKDCPFCMKPRIISTSTTTGCCTAEVYRWRLLAVPPETTDEQIETKVWDFVKMFGNRMLT